MLNGNSRKLHLLCLTLFCALCYAPDAPAQRFQGGPRAAQYLADHEPELKETTSRLPRISLLMKLASAALEAGELGKAGGYAREALALGETQKEQPGVYSDVAHVSQIVLGRIALQRGEVGKAKEHLLAAGSLSGSPVLKTFGPNMSLAKELIERGERDAVLSYLDLCAKFWEMQGDRLETWKAAIRQGRTPSFGPNLTVGLVAWRNDTAARPAR